MMKVRDYMGTAVSGRCMKCQEKKDFTVTTADRANNGVVILKGACPTCSTTVCRMAGKIED